MGLGGMYCSAVEDREGEVDEKPGGENWGSGQKCRALARFIEGKARPGGSSNIMQRSRRVAHMFWFGTWGVDFKPPLQKTCLIKETPQESTLT